MSGALASRAGAIVALNDAFRRAGPSCDWSITPGIAERGAVFVALAYQRIAAFEEFDEHNHPHGERDFGVFELNGEHVIWKIDCYDADLRCASPDPADASVTRRTMTIMRGGEW